jgi:hypothetical protein
MAEPDIKNIELLPDPIPGVGPPAPEPDTKNLDALLASLNGSAERFQTLWFSFLGLTLYLAIAALATTHRNLLLGEPQILPILNIKVELLPFYVIAPLLYLVFHFYRLMMLVRTATEFENGSCSRRSRKSTEREERLPFAVRPSLLALAPAFVVHSEWLTLLLIAPPQRLCRRAALVLRSAQRDWLPHWPFCIHIRTNPKVTDAMGAPPAVEG